MQTEINELVQAVANNLTETTNDPYTTIKELEEQLKQQQMLLKQEKRRLKEQLKAELKEEKRLMKEELKEQKRQEKIDGYYDADGYEIDPKTGLPLPHLKNYRNFFKVDEIYGDRLWKNTFSETIYIDENTELNKDKITEIQARISDIFKGHQQASKESFMYAADAIANEHKKNPIIEYLESLNWDGQVRAEEVFIKYMGVNDTPINRIMTKKWLLGAVMRVYEPGCEFHQMIILSGAQGVGKTSIGKILANAPLRIRDTGKQDNRYFANAPKPDESDQKVYEKICNAWFVSVEELLGFKKSDNTAIKDFLSRDKETCRLAWGVVPGDYKRHCVFFGSTNDECFLKDYSDNKERRIWPMRCNINESDVKAYEITQEYLDQLWGEIVYYYKNQSFNWWLTPEELNELTILQKGFKTSEEDNRLDELHNIFFDKKFKLNEAYEFVNYDDFKNQMNGIINYNNGRESVTLDKIPMIYINRYMNECNFKKLSPKYIQNSGNDFTVKKIKYGDCTKVQCITLTFGFRDLRGKIKKKADEIEDKDVELQNLFNIGGN